MVWNTCRVSAGMSAGVAVGTAFLFLPPAMVSAIAGPCEIATLPQEKPAPDHPGPAFPVEAGPGLRHLVDAEGKPFFLHGDAAWSLIAQLNDDDAATYLEDRRARGFNAVLVNLLEHRFSSLAPANIHGDAPFLIPVNYTTPNASYFAHADRVLKRACDMGILVLLAPSYQGNGAGPEGWYREMAQNGAEAMRSYGRYLGRRYGGLDNIIWVHGGDYNPPDKNLVNAMVEGIDEYDLNAVHTAHGSPGSPALGHWADESWLTINTVYTYDSVRNAALAEFERTEAMPFFLIEGLYENEYDTKAIRIRAQAYQALLAGASGHVFGNNPIWHFDGPGLFPVEQTWKEALASPGAQSMEVLHKVIAGIEWWKLEPDVSHRLADANASELSGALANDGSFALLYLATSQRLQLDLSHLADGLVEARWIDPTNGLVIEADGSPFEGRRPTVTPPGSNNSGDSDWLLLLTSRGEDVR